MDSLSLTRAYLESQTTGDLLKIADKFGIDIPDNPERILLIDELLDITSEEDEGFCVQEESATTDLVLPESVPLPKQYNITFIEVMIRDPFWAFVFWEIKASDREQFEKAESFSGYYLKVSNLNNEGNSSRKENEGLFKVQVRPEDTAWYLSLSPAFEDDSWAAQSRFKVEFCASSGGVETVLAVSNPIRLPGLCESTKQEGVLENQLVSLSGYGDFHVLRRKERHLRSKSGEGSPSNE